MTKMMSIRLVRPCPLCAFERGTIRHVQHLAVPDEYGTSGELSFATCDRCGFAFANVGESQEHIDRTYAERSKYADADVIADASFTDPPWDAERLANVASRLALAIPDRGTRVLDAGCAGGSFLGYMKELGFTSLVGIDPSPRATEVAARIHGVHTVAGSFMTAGATLGTFGLVTLQHTLEHLRDVRPAIAALRDLLDDGGLAYVEVPDACRYAELLFAPFHDFNTEHINHFSLDALVALARSAGFLPVDAFEKTIACSPRHPYPAACGLFRKGGERDRSSAEDIAYDRRLVEAIDAFIDRSRALMTQIDGTLRTALRDEEEVVLWGTGQLAYRLLRDTVLAEKHVVLVDGARQKQGLHVDGRPIVAPSTLSPDGAPIVMTSVVAADAIEAAIRQTLGTRRCIIRLPECLRSSTHA